MNSFFRHFALVVAGSFLILQHTQAQVGTNNPTGVAGDYNGQITTAGSYDPFTGNASREIEDIVVAGSVGAYPLRWVRRLNTRGVIPGNPLGGNGGWSHSYQWDLKVYNPEPTPTPHPSATPWAGGDGVLTYPDGRTVQLIEPWEPVCCDAAAESPFGRFDRIVKDNDAGEGGNWKLLLADGGEVKFHAPSATSQNYKATSIIDPYGQAITLVYEGNLLKKIKEPGINPRYLEIFYETKSNPGLTVIQRVEANDGRGNVTQSVTYTYERQTTIITNPTLHFSYWYLTRADYSDGTRADYAYEDTNMPRYHATDGDAVFYKLVSECKDVRFAGPMKTIRYDYVARSEPDPGTGWGQIRGEKNAYSNVLSWVPLYYNPPPWYNEDISREEYRADNSSREFRYHGDSYAKSITDFYGNPSQASIYVDPQGGGVSEVRFTDARLKTTVKTREPNFAATVRVTHPPSDSPPYESAYTETHYSDPARPHYIWKQIDERHNMTEYIRYPNHMVQQVNYPDGGYETFTYNSLGQVTEHRMTSGGTEYFSYDQRGLKETYTPPATDPSSSPAPTQYFYYGGPSGPGEVVEAPERSDLIDRLRRMIDGRGYSTYYYYNPRGQITHTIHHDGTGVENHYNDNGTLQWTEDELHHRTSYQYDVYGRVTHTTNHLGETVINYYAPEGVNPLLHTTSSIYRVESHLGKKTDHFYDLNFRRRWTKQAPGHQIDEAITNFLYDSVGNLEWVEDPRHRWTKFGYDERNRQTSIRNQDLNETTEIGYDPAGNKVFEKRPDQVFRSWDYDEMNRLEHAYDWRTNPDPLTNQTTTYARDYAGNPTFVTDTKGAVYGFEHDALNRKTKATYPTTFPNPSPTETWHYDLAGNIDEYKNPAGQIRHFHHDHRNRQDHSWWTGSGLLGPDIATVYDYASRVSSITTNNGQTIVAFGYDAANRKIWEDQTLAASPGQSAAISHRVKTDPDQDGRRINLQIVDPPATGGGLVVSEEMSGSGSYSVTYDYTERNQLKHIYGGMAENWTFTYAYDPSGNMISRQADYDGGTNITSCPEIYYDAANRPTRWEQTAPKGLNAFSEHQYDHANREVSVWRVRDGEGRGDRFAYEPTNQLSGVGYKAHDVSTWPPAGAERTVIYGYTSDKLNRSTVTDNGVPTSYTPNGLNQYTTVGGTAFSYDNNFNLTGAGGLLANYNSANQLVAANNATELPEAYFVYDGLGRCVKRIIAGEVTVFVFDGWKPIGEFDAWNNFQAWNVYGPGPDEILLRQKDNQGYTFFLLDRHGNVAFLIDNDGMLLETYTYDVFGRPTLNSKEGTVISSSWYTHNFLFQGREYISQLGIYDYRNRFYHPNTGRFLQIDPTGFDAGDMNLFRYCGDDPVDRSDPLGLIDSNNFDPNSIDYKWADRANLKKYSNFFTYGAHGGEHEHNFGQVINPRYRSTGVVIPAKDVISSIKGNSLFAQKSGTLLLVCHSGEKGSTLARSVAMGTGKDVLAPSKYLWLLNQKSHPFVVAGGYRDPRTGELKMNTADPGHLTRFFPDGSSRAGADYKLSQRDAIGARPVAGPGVNVSRGSSGPTAAEVDAAHQATGVPSLGAEAVNMAPGRP